MGTHCRLILIEVQRSSEIRLFRQPYGRARRRAAIEKARTMEIFPARFRMPTWNTILAASRLSRQRPLDGHADAVFGSRYMAGEQSRVFPFWHSMINQGLTLVSNMFCNLNLTDMETCYKVFRTDLLKSIPIRSDRFGLEPEIVMKSAKRKLRIYEVPINVTPDGPTKKARKSVRRTPYRTGAYLVLVIDQFRDPAPLPDVPGSRARPRSELAIYNTMLFANPKSRSANRRPDRGWIVFDRPLASIYLTRKSGI